MLIYLRLILMIVTIHIMLSFNSLCNVISMSSEIKYEFEITTPR